MKQKSKPRCHNREPWTKDQPAMDEGREVIIPARWMEGCRILDVDKDTLEFDCSGCRWSVDEWQ